MNKRLFILFIIVISIHSANAQSNVYTIPSILSHNQTQDEYNEIMDVRPSIIKAQVYQKIPTPPIVDIKQVTRYLNYNYIESPSTRYAINNLKYSKQYDKGVSDAINVLLKYIENRKLNSTISYLKDYTEENMYSQEKALHELQNFITRDSIEYNSYLGSISAGDEYLNTDLQILNNYLQQDSNYLWMRDASRDSVLMNISNVQGGSPIKFWTNTGHTRIYRYWTTNVKGDTIGAWVQVEPKGNHIRFFTDEDVSQAGSLSKQRRNENIISNQLDSERYNIIIPQLGDIKRRYWTYYTTFDLGMNQSYKDNGQSNITQSLSLLTNIKSFLNYAKNKTTLNNWIHYRYGTQKSDKQEFRKNNDYLELNSQLNQNAFKSWLYSARFNVQTQLFKTYTYPDSAPKEKYSSFFSPGYFILSVGMTYKPNDNFSLYLSPIAGSWTYLRDTTGINVTNFGVKKGKRITSAAGMEININHKSPTLFDVLVIENYFKIFYSYERKDKYLNFETDEQQRKNFTPVLEWRPTLKFSINYFLSATMWGILRYNETETDNIQLDQSLNLGVSFRF